ncbi:hypothetical protein [Hyphococcus lacteus]|uniref:Uncharacterized protein n=1 Tax=Hyphococcus lacteus TaxID=3143536 RepID=A0ABV3Z7J4_9PROT
MIEKMIENLYTALKEERLNPLFQYPGKLITLLPGLTESDANTVYDAG